MQTGVWVKIVAKCITCTITVTLLHFWNHLKNSVCLKPSNPHKL